MKTTAKRILISILANLAVCLSANALSDALKIKIINGSVTDETVIRFLPMATNGFDGSYDAYKLFSSSPTAPAIFTRIDSVTELSINALPSMNAPLNIPVCMNIKVAATYTLQAIEMGTGFPAASSIKLEDTQTGIIYNFRNGQSITLPLSINSPGSANRFLIHFAPPAPTMTASTSISCHGMNDGSITATKTGNMNWNYQLKDSNDSLISSATGVIETVVIPGLPAGTYTLHTSGTGIITDSSIVTIQDHPAVTAAFAQSRDTVFLPSAGVSFNNTSINGPYANWNFGDGGTSDSLSSFHTYISTGIFTVTLTVSDSAGCTSDISKDVNVQPGLSTGIETTTASSQGLMVSQQGDALSLRLNCNAPSQVNITVYNNIGQLLYSHEEKNTVSFYDSAPLSATGTYIVHSVINGKAQSKTYSFLH